MFLFSRQPPHILAPLVVDIGEFQIKSGFSLDSLPRSTVPSCVAIAKRYQKRAFEPSTFRASYIGRDVSNMCGILEIEKRKEQLLDDHKISRGASCLATILHHIIYGDLRVLPAEHTILVSNFGSEMDLEKEALVQELFETFAFYGLSIVDPHILNLYSAGLVSGLSIDIGYKRTRVGGFDDGKRLKDTFDNYELGASSIDRLLMRRLQASGLALDNSLSSHKLIRLFLSFKTILCREKVKCI
ncbi:MAG: hypothetical protein MHMPM18_004030 [Marteilia pararefringens]